MIFSDVIGKYRSEEDERRVDDLGLPATTDLALINYSNNKSDMPSVVFSTYQSIDAVIAQRIGLPELKFDEKKD